MTGKMISLATVLGSLIWLSGCSIYRDVPDFSYPDPQIPAGTPAPRLQPTGPMIENAAEDPEVYDATVSAISARRWSLLRRTSDLSGGTP